MATEIKINRFNIIPSPNPPIKNLHNFTNSFSVFVPQNPDPPNINHIILSGRVFRDFPVNTNYVCSVLGKATRSGPKFMAIERKSTQPLRIFKVGNASYRAKIWDPPVIKQVSILGRALFQTPENKIKGCPVKGRARKVDPKVIVLVSAGRYGLSKHSRYDKHDGAVRMLAQSNEPRGGKCIEFIKRRGPATSSVQSSILKESNRRGLTFDVRSITPGNFHVHHHENCGSTVVGPMVQVEQFITKNTDNHPLPYGHNFYSDNQLPLHVPTCPHRVNEKQGSFTCGEAGPSPITSPKITSLRPRIFGQRRAREVNTVGPFKTEFKVGFGPMIVHFVPMEVVLNMAGGSVVDNLGPFEETFNMGNGAVLSMGTWGDSKLTRTLKANLKDNEVRMLSNPTGVIAKKGVIKVIDGRFYGKGLNDSSEGWTSPQFQRVSSSHK